MKLTVSCQVCGRIIQEVDNGLGDDFPFSVDDVAMYQASASCEVDGITQISTFFTRKQTSDELEAELAATKAQLSDTQDLLDSANAHLAALSDVQAIVDQLNAANDQLVQDQVLISDLQTQVNDETTKAQIFAGAMTQQRALGERAMILADMTEEQLVQPVVNIHQVKALMDEMQTLITQVTRVADDSLGNPPPKDPMVWVNFPPERYDEFQNYLAAQDPPVDPIGPLDVNNIVEMTANQYVYWQQYLTENP